MNRRGFIFGLGATIAVARVAPLMRIQPLLVPERKFVTLAEVYNSNIPPGTYKVLLDHINAPNPLLAELVNKIVNPPLVLTDEDRVRVAGRFTLSNPVLPPDEGRDSVVARPRRIS